MTRSMVVFVQRLVGDLEQPDGTIQPQLAALWKQVLRQWPSARLDPEPWNAAGIGCGVLIEADWAEMPYLITWLHEQGYSCQHAIR